MPPGTGQEGFLTAPDGGLEELEQLFRFSESPSTFLQDAIIISVDLEASGGKYNTLQVNRKQVKGVREVGIAVLDTRSIFTLTPDSQPTLPPLEAENEGSRISLSKRHPFITTRQFSTSHSSEEFEDCDVTDFRESVFAKTRRVERKNLVKIIIRCLQFRDDSDDIRESHGADVPASGLRPIVIVGHSPQRDLEIIRRLGVDVSRAAPVAAVFDTYWLSKSILAPSGLQKFALTDVLTELGVAHSWRDLHNAGNDATYTLYVFLRLAIRWA